MSEHRIRLRGGWEWHATAADEPARRVTLPLDGPPGTSQSVRLVRLFNRPPIDPARESLFLELEQVEGLATVLLNGRVLARPTRGTSGFVIPLDDSLPARNVLVLEVEPPANGRERLAWGHVALVIRPTEASAPDR